MLFCEAQGEGPQAPAAQPKTLLAVLSSISPVQVLLK